MTNSCENCRFWRPEYGAIGDSQFGDCRRYPPEIVDRLVDEALEDGEGPEATAVVYRASCFPVTFQGDWCGHHEEKR